jgi:hypothetical protein
MANNNFEDAVRWAENAPAPPEPLWPAVIAALAVGGLYLALPKNLTVGPRWVPLVLVSVIEAAALWAKHKKWYGLASMIGHFLSALLTLFMVASLGLLIHALPLHKEPATRMLRSASCLWITNILVFASWYWRLDAGGPHKRSLDVGHTDGAFLFPQMTLDDEKKRRLGGTNWEPHFLDYLFLAFNTSTALSPTDTPVLSRWAKLMSMVQATISLAIIALLAARAVNIL